ncbi:uncharacterized protein LOC128556246 [Mercenaria mercenaria]|uniref:uncharacterized protein LOC128556246 n=1 Tax=Mercenaria mercenaria TaxID=6596 RepID=UPI00234F0B65|nr:uncharacterized protein LOC128556246 [Mercenaria mercenaria]XP_053396686.1 uncharacterized protein LOC128556246 [Mercenaria mercenaria]
MLLRRYIALRMLYLYLVTCKTYIQSLQQIFYKTFDNIDSGSEVENIPYIPKHNIYPVIHLPKSCPFSPLKTCSHNEFYWKQFEQHCNGSAYCPNGTHVQCVENEEYPWKGVLLVCGPIGNCDRDARHVVYFDKSRPYIYQLGKKKCEDGRHHLNYNICFGDCTLDNRIRIVQKSTPITPATAYCNYEIGYCNAEKPKIFELIDESDTCYSTYEREHRPCPPGKERLPDCSCEDLCNDGYVRDSANDFECKISSKLFVSTDVELFRMKIIIQQYAAGLRLTWDFSFENGICVKALKVTYWEADKLREISLDDIILTNEYPKHTDIEPLFPGQTYVVKVQIVYDHDGNLRNITLQRTRTMRPNPVENVTVCFTGGNVELKWETPRRSMQDHYSVEYRMVRRNRKPSWLNNRTRDCKYTLQHPFPGEEYDFRVYSVSNRTSSEDKTIGLVVPPLPPHKLHRHFPSPSTTDVIIFWFKNDTRSHVEKWNLRYNLSNGDNYHMDIPLPDDGNHVQATLSDFRRGQTYSVLVYSLVGDVCSAVPARIDVKIPVKEEKGVPIFVWLILGGILIFLAAAVIFLVVLVLRKVSVINHVSNIFNINRLQANVNNDIGDLNIPLADVIHDALNNNNNAAISDDSSDSEDR